MNEYHELTAPAGTVAELVEALTRPGVTTGALITDYTGRHLVAVEVTPATGGYNQRVRLRFGRQTR